MAIPDVLAMNSRTNTKLGGPNRDAAEVLDILTKEAKNQLGFNEQALFSVGDGLQRIAVDTIFNLFRPQTWTPNNIQRLSSLLSQQIARTSELLISPQVAELAWRELSNKIEVFVLVSNMESVLGLSENQFVPLPELVQRAYSTLPPFEALWAVEGMGQYYTNLYWQLHGPPKGLLQERNARVWKKSLLMLHAGMGLFFANYLLGPGTPTLISGSSPAEFRCVIEQFVRLARDNAREGYLGPVIESLGLVTCDFYSGWVPIVDNALRQVAPELLGFYWHGVGRALYFSRRYFLPVLSTVWTGIDSEVETAPERESAMAGLTWAVALVNMRQPEIMEGVLRTYIQDSPLQNGFANGVASSLIMRQDTTPDAPFISSFCNYRNASRPRSDLWEQLVAGPCNAALDRYYPALKQHHALGEVFRYQELGTLVAQLEGGNARPRPQMTAWK